MRYSCTGAPTGHVLAQAPHSIHVSASITYFESPSLIALTGHSAAHAPQLMQSSVILYAMKKHLLERIGNAIGEAPGSAVSSFAIVSYFF